MERDDKGIAVAKAHVAAATRALIQQGFTRDEIKAEVDREVDRFTAEVAREAYRGPQ